jgi:hypothetical protein
MSSVLLGGPPPQTPSHPPQPSGAPDGAGSQGGRQRDSTVTVIAGVGVLLLAMGVGVLIGRSGGSSQHAATSPQVITVAPTGGGAGTAGTGAGAGAGTVSDEWPAGTNGYTVQLQTLPVSGATSAAVTAAKSAASAKGAKSVGVLKSDDFKSLTAGHYVIYSGVYHTRAQASKALAALKRSFPGASVIAVSSRGASSAAEATGGGAGSAKPPPPSSLSHPAPPTVLKSLRQGGGKSYEQKSKELPNVIETG